MQHPERTAPIKAVPGEGFTTPFMRAHQGVVMVQSDEEGGSMHASRAAIELGRVLAVPVPAQAELASNEPKTGANKVLVGPDLQERARLLKCSVEAPKRVFRLTSKADASSGSCSTWR